MEQHRYAAILFDLGRVLINIDFDAFPRSLGIDPAQASPDDRRNVGRLVISYETGRLSSDEFFKKLAEHFHRRYSIEQLLEAWNAIIKDENSPIVPIVEAVQADHVVAVFSNTSPTHFQKAVDCSTLLTRFPKRYLSYLIGAVKPDPAIYNYIIRDLQTDPQNILFIDDVEENIAAARQCGMVGILFENAAKLEKDLRDRGVMKLE